jgi:hypothetical protein
MHPSCPVPGASDGAPAARRWHRAPKPAACPGMKTVLPCRACAMKLRLCALSPCHRPRAGGGATCLRFRSRLFRLSCLRGRLLPHLLQAGDEVVPESEVVFRWRRPGREVGEALIEAIGLQETEGLVGHGPILEKEGKVSLTFIALALSRSSGDLSHGQVSSPSKPCHSLRGGPPRGHDGLRVIRRRGDIACTESSVPSPPLSRSRW